MSDEKLRVISIAHTGVSRAAGRLRYAPFEHRDDVDVHLVVPSRWKQFGRSMTADPGSDPGVTTHVMPILFPDAGPFSWYLHVYRGLGKLIRETRPHVIHLWEEPWSFIALQARLLKGDAALVLEVDQNILKRLPPPFEAIRGNVLANTAHLLSRSSDATMVARARGYDGPVSKIGYGVDQQVFKPMPEGGNRPERPPLTLGYVGRLIEEKGIQDVLEAMAMTSAPVLLKLVGEGPYEAELRQRAERLGLSDRLTIVPWSDPEGVATFIRSLDALVLLTHTTPTVKEQFGRVIIEAQACGTPVIGARSGAIPDIVGKGGWIVPERDPGAVAELIAHIQAHPEERHQKAADGLENIRTGFTYDAIADQLLSAWKAAARTRQRSVPQRMTSAM